MNVALALLTGSQAGKEKHEMNIQKLLVCSEMWRGSPFSKTTLASATVAHSSFYPPPPRSAPQTAIDFAIHPAEILASERARHPDLLLPVEEGVEASMKRQGWNRERWGGCGRWMRIDRDRRGVRVMGERGFMHKLRSTIDGHRGDCVCLCVYFDYSNALDKQDFGNTNVT